MTIREVTQFSMVEFNAFKKGMEEMGASFQATSTRERAMAMFVTNLPSYTFDGFGGIENIARVRVLGNPTVALDQQPLKFDFVPKLPPTLVAERKRQAEKEAKRKAFVAEMEKLRNDPKRRQALIDAAIEAMGRGLVMVLLKGLSKRPAGAKSAPAKKPARKGPPKKFDPYEAALRQDHQNRIEASKEAAKRFHEEHDKRKAS